MILKKSGKIGKSVFDTAFVQHIKRNTAPYVDYKGRGDFCKLWDEYKKQLDILLENEQVSQQQRRTWRMPYRITRFYVWFRDTTNYSEKVRKSKIKNYRLGEP